MIYYTILTLNVPSAVTEMWRFFISKGGNSMPHIKAVHAKALDFTRVPYRKGGVQAEC